MHQPKPTKSRSVMYKTTSRTSKDPQGSSKKYSCHGKPTHKIFSSSNKSTPIVLKPFKTPSSSTSGKPQKTSIITKDPARLSDFSRGFRPKGSGPLNLSTLTSTKTTNQYSQRTTHMNCKTKREKSSWKSSNPPKSTGHQSSTVSIRLTESSLSAKASTIQNSTDSWSQTQKPPCPRLKIDQ